MKIEVANIRLFTRKLCATFVNINLMENNKYVFALQLILENKEKSKFVQTD